MATPESNSISEENLNLFRYRVLIVLLAILIVLLAIRSCSPALQPAPPTEPALPPANTANPTGTATDAPSPPVTPTPSPPPATLVTPIVTPSATASSLPTPSATMTETAAPVGADCGGLGDDFGSYWVVRGCDTLYRISQITGVSLEVILSANPEIFDPDVIFPGQVIRLPGRG